MSKDKNSVRVLIIGAGASGIAAASLLFESGFKNVTILEAENRIGGRLYSAQLGEYSIDLGGQWVCGEQDNFVYELAWPLGLLEYSKVNGLPQEKKLFGSSGVDIPQHVTADLFKYFSNICQNIPDNANYLNVGSFGYWAEKKLNEYFQEHPKITPDLHKPLINFINLTMEPGEDWHHISVRRFREIETCVGDQQINWKNQTYGMVFDLLMKKYPNPKKELPVTENIILNSKIIKISYDTSDGMSKVITENGKVYEADHVIFTGSLGVLKANYKKLFDPPLPDIKIKAINNLGMSKAAKIYLYYEKPWWIDDIYLKGIFWTEDDRQKISNDPHKRWMLSVCGVWPIEHKPKLLCMWLIGPHSQEMELIADEILRDQIFKLLKTFFGQAYTVTEPLTIKRSLWNTNENFYGTYSFPSLESEKVDVYPRDLAEPIMKNNKPILQFAGEAVAHFPGTAHGAIASGRKEASQLIKYYSAKN